MPEDAPVNIGALLLTPYRAQRRVLDIQSKLHRWAVADLGRRFDDLFNLVVDPAVMVTAWLRVRENKGALTPGVDKRTMRSIEVSTGGVERFLEDLRVQVKARVFRPLPVRRRLIPKAGGRLRALGIPVIADRVVQACLKLVLEPILESNFSSSSYGFRPRRRAQDAIEDVRHHAHKGYEWVVEADIAACFDEIPHPVVMDRLRGRVGDRRVLALVKAFLRSGVLDEFGVVRVTRAGAPQGGVLSPLLANLVLSVVDEHFDRIWASYPGGSSRKYARDRKGLATYRLVRYADDFVVLVFGNRSHAEALLGEIVDVLSGIGLRLALDKTRVVHIDEGFDFLGYRIQRHRQWGSDRWFVYSYPSRKSMASVRRNLKIATDRRNMNQSARVMFLRLGAIARGWVMYFRYGASKAAFNHLQHYLWCRVWSWLRKKHRKQSRKWIVARYCRNGWWPSADGVELFKPSSVPIERHRYRGNRIPTPWTHVAQTITA